MKKFSFSPSNVYLSDIGMYGFTTFFLNYYYSAAGTGGGGGAGGHCPPPPFLADQLTTGADSAHPLLLAS